ncbi:MAG: peptide/nickel transport system permease protein [Solirubrobacteraceae bacterium]|nr:peptide/nickel transport system permease protein [Solirubrobacteraceae bacterium]
MSAVAGAAEVHPESVVGSIQGRSPRQIFWGRFRQDRAAMLGGIVVVVLLLLAIFAGVISNLVGHGPNTPYLNMTDDFGIPKGPNSSFWFGADGSGRDLFVRVLYGARTSLMVAAIATTISMTVGTTVGVIAGFYRGWVDTVISRASDVVLALPQLLLAIGIAAACGTTPQCCMNGLVQPGLSLVIFVISAFTWPYIARIVRSTTLSLREKEFVEAARSLGASNMRIIFREILPNLVAPITIWATLLIPGNILFEAALSFLGLGVPVTTASWGSALSEASDGGLYRDAPWMMIFPGIFLVMTTLAFNLLGDGLRDALDPRSER